jgi:hypothetical protein
MDVGGFHLGDDRRLAAPGPSVEITWGDWRAAFAGRAEALYPCGAARKRLFNAVCLHAIADMLGTRFGGRVIVKH